MNSYVMEALEYEKVKQDLKQYALSQPAKRRIEQLKPSTNLNRIKVWMNETSEARKILEVNSSVPLTALENVDGAAVSIEGRVMTPEELSAVKGLLQYVKRLKKFMDSMQTIGPTVASYASSMFELPQLYDEIDRCIVNGTVDDRATPELSRLRKKIKLTDDRIKQKLNSILSSSTYSEIIQEALVTTRNGRFVIPVKREYRKSIAGNVLDVSSSGSTVFIEPAAIAMFQEELNILKIQEENEVFQILSELTEMVESSSREISINVEAMVHYDFIFARAKYSKSLDGSAVHLNTSRIINIKGGRHPLLGKDAVPLDFYIGDDYRALIITGPNTGGKTVTLKTVGLLTLMVQSGLHVPVQEGSEFAVFSDILADIGDGQSIEQSLSTFSSHVRNIVGIIESSNPNSLVVLDEIGAGTEPGEGMGFAIAVLEEVFNKGATLIASTHISEIKEFAENTPGFRNGCMTFDIESLQPLYQLKIGQSGPSNAFLIALRLGVERRIVERAHEITYGEKKDYSGDDIFKTRPIVEQTRIIRTEPTEVDNQISTKDSKKPKHREESKFQKGDCVFISTMNRTGIVCETANSRGEVVVMVMKKKYKINHKRLSLKVEARDLYPENYDLDIVFESKEDRKKRKQFSKHHMEGVVIETQPDE